MEISVVRKDEGKLIRTVCKLFCVVFAVAMIVMLSSKAVSADATLEKSGEDEYFRYELYSDGELKITCNYSDYNDYYFYLSHIGDDALSKVKTVTVDLAGYEDGIIYLSGYDSDTTGITGIKFIDLREDVEIECLLVDYFTSVDSFDFLSDVRIDELDIGNGFQNADLSGAKVKCPWIYGDDLTSVILPDVCESAYFRGCEKLKKCYIPTGLKYVWASYYTSVYGDGYNYCFEECDSLTDVYYAGSKSEFEEIKILLAGEGGTGKVAKNMNISDLLTGVNIHYYNGITSEWYQKPDDSWIYLDQNGETVTGWQKIGNSWYYFDEEGIMQTGWFEDGGSWYYLTSSGAMATGWQEVSGSWYYFDVSGKMKTGWQKIGGKDYFLKPNGAMASDEYVDGYYLDKSGAWTYKYRASWKSDSKGTYFQDTKGWYPKNQWLLIDDEWYFFKPDGYKAASEYWNGYWFNLNGGWTYKARASWKKDSKGWYYQDTAGWYPRSCDIKIDGKVYNFDASGYCTNP